MDKNSKQREGSCNPAFVVDGAWEKAGGRAQTRAFAEAFVRNFTIPFRQFSLLDVGCALGDALPVFRKAYPEAKLSGCDVGISGIKRCRSDYGAIAEFHDMGFRELDGFWDVIYCSNVLEHFSDYVEIAALMVRKCRVLYVMTPYFELHKDGRPLTAEDYGHVATLHEHSFDELYGRGLLEAPLETKIFRAPKAWSPPLPKEIVRQLRRRAKMAITGKFQPPKNWQICYELRRKDAPGLPRP